MAGREVWTQLFRENGWLRHDGSIDSARVTGVGIAFVSGTDRNFLRLEDVVRLTDDFVVVKYGYEAPMVRMPWQTAHESGWTQIWLPWENILYVYENTP